MKRKIHCDLLEVFGPDWEAITTEHAECLSDAVHNQQTMLGEEPNLYGFVGTRRLAGTVGGFFAIQYHENEFHYDRQKRLAIRPSQPFERLFFVLFPATGKLLLQNARLARKDLNMRRALRLFQQALQTAFARCRLGTIVGFYPAPTSASREDFIREFESSSRVIRLEVSDPLPERVPETFTYYNPQRDRNAIVRESHRNDYGNLKKVNLMASQTGDLKRTHLSDLVESGRPEVMVYYHGSEERIIRRQARQKYEFYVDTDVEMLSETELALVLQLLRRERATLLDTPTASGPRPQQMRLPTEPESTELP